MTNGLNNATGFRSDPLSERWIDLRLVSITRAMLALSALLVILIDPIEGQPYTSLAYATLVLYSFYSAVLLFLSVRQSQLVPVRYLHWFDLGWFLLLIAFTRGSSSIFFNYFFFAILVASFGWGYLSGLRVTLTCAFLFVVVAFLTATAGMTTELNRFLLRTIELLILGFLIARWGGFKINLRNRLQLLKEVTVLSNARFGIDRTISSILESLRTFFEADACLLLLPAPEQDGKPTYQMYRVRQGAHPTGAAPPQISGDAAALFLSPSSSQAVIRRKDGRKQTRLFNLDTREVSIADSKLSDKVANALETTNYLSIPVRHRNRSMGRLYVIGGPHEYDDSAMDFVLQLLDHVAPLIENIRLVDSLASYAADEERRRIARDIHDSVIQPYVGLQLGIAALSQKLHSGNTDVLNNVEELLEMTNEELVGLRRYVWGLRAGEERRDVLMPAIERFATRFSSVTGINVDVQARGKIEVNDRLAAELFQMVAEGLSNVRRHALCNDASVDLACDGGKVILKIKNPRPPENAVVDGHNHEEPTLFRPRSISERAAQHGGQTVVSIDELNHTVVTVAIPL